MLSIDNWNCSYLSFWNRFQFFRRLNPFNQVSVVSVSLLQAFELTFGQRQSTLISETRSHAISKISLELYSVLTVITNDTKVFEENDFKKSTQLSYPVQISNPKNPSTVWNTNRLLYWAKMQWILKNISKNLNKPPNARKWLSPPNSWFSLAF